MTTQHGAADNETSDLTAAMQEVRGADTQLSISLEEGAAPAVLTDGAIKAVTDTEIEVLRERARRERDKGVKNLEKRHDGVASVITNVALNERVIGSAFERWFAGIENGIQVVSKRGVMFVGEKAADQLVQTINKMVVALETEVATDLAAVTLRLEITRGADFIEPTYSKPASEHEVQLRTPLSNRVLNVIKKHDVVLTGLAQLHWNGEIEQAHIEEQESKSKKGLRDLASFLRRTIRGMRAKVEAKEASAANDTATMGVAASPQLVEEAA